VLFGSWDDPATVVRALLGGALAVATVILGLVWFVTGALDRHLAELLGVLWVFWVVFHDTLNLVVRPLGRMFTSVAYGDAPPAFTIDEETAYLERLLDSPAADRHRKVLTAVRLAEIYRTHQGDGGRADRLLAEMRARYPDARELDAARSRP